MEKFSLDLQKEKIGMLNIISQSTKGIDAHTDNNILVNERGFRTHISTEQASYMLINGILTAT